MLYFQVDSVYICISLFCVMYIQRLMLRKTRNCIKTQKTSKLKGQRLKGCGFWSHDRNKTNVYFLSLHVAFSSPPTNLRCAVKKHRKITNMPKAKKSGKRKRFDYNQDRKKMKKKFIKKYNPRIEKWVWDGAVR